VSEGCPKIKNLASVAVGSGSIFPFPGETGKIRSRRVSPVHLRPGEGPFSGSTTAA
jgi:hypothetical protein